MKWLGILFMAVLMASAPGYVSAQVPTSTTTQSQSSEVKGEPAKAANGLSAAERDAYETKITRELELIQQRIAELRIEASNGPPQNKRVLSLAANNLQMLKIAADNELLALKEASDGNWEAQKAKLEITMGQLREAL